MTPEEVPTELILLAWNGDGPGADIRKVLASVLTRWEEIRPQVCPYDCDGCHDDECPCDRLGCAGYEEDDNPGGSCAEGVPCPPFEDVTLEISPDPPEPGAFARAAFGDEWTERTAAGYAARRAQWECEGGITKMWFGEEHGWLTYDEAVARGFRDKLGAQPIVYPVNDDG